MKKLLTILFTLLLTVTLACVNTNSVKALDPVEIDDSKELIDFLSSTGTSEGILKEDNYLLNGEIEVKGNKTLDLNGKTIKADDSYRGNMFKITGTLTVNDSSNPDSGIIDGGYSENTTHSSYICGFYIVDDGSLTINGGTIKNMYVDPEHDNGGAIYNLNGTLIITGGLITNCVARNGGAIANLGASLTISGGTIENCSAEFGGAIFNNTANNKDSKIEITGGKIKNCESKNYGGAILNECVFFGYQKASELIISENAIIENCKSYYGGAIVNWAYSGSATLKINNKATIKDCEANFGGAIYNKTQSENDKGFAYLEINGATITDCVAFEGGAIYCERGKNKLISGTIKNCKSNYSAISIYENYDSSNLALYLDGGFTFNNKNDLGIEDDIFVYDDTTIALTKNFESTNKKIGISYNPDYLGEGVTKDDVVICDGYTLEGEEILKDIFASINGQEYLAENGNSATNHSLSFKSVQITSQPSWDNSYEVKTDAKDTPVNVTYQWYQGDILEEVQINEPKNYKGSKYIDLTVSLDGCDGTYNNNKWINLKDREDSVLMKLEGLKKDETVSFNYKGDSKTANVTIALLDEDDNTDYYFSSDNKEGSYVGVVPNDGTYKLYVYSGDSSWDYTYIEVSDIVVRHRKVEKIETQTSAKLTKPSADADIFCEVTFKNDDGNKITIDSNILNFGKAISGDRQNITKGSNKEVTIELEATDIEYDYFDGVNGKVSLDGMIDLLEKDVDYEYEEGSIILKLQGEYVSKLDTGKHSLFIKKSDVSGKECIVATLNIVNPTSSNTSVYKDESCEKIIGPTWHWNNKKGVCEEYTAVKTVTR